ncbi:GGDEF domain-containing protein [Desulfovibrio psychrotolerans]|uniref:diguanylate cyclase n=1 Tax=Desulfovibrio psychrotolerans TaxID=415242 RepID=A0A7J0BRP6_9BACT|nr:diguanylate cyclase [Desulfovibrio psychrotolerans]GFM35684.1 diguanylate cyclase response regulator [Desulfovibrio psychrotolerans]
MLTANRDKEPIRAFLISGDGAFVRNVISLWDGSVIQWTVFSKAGPAVDQLFTDPPELLVSDAVLPDMSGEALVALVKGENVYRQIPVLLCLPRETLFAPRDWSAMEADDFVLLPFEPEEFRARVELTLNRMSRSLDANPLTRLPGNTTIIQFIREHIERRRDFALGYADLDNFKAFNDKYGFARGDEALMMTARIIVNTVRRFPGPPSFVGHVGGDDFVFALPLHCVEEACRQLVSSFDAIVPSLYDEKDRECGCILSTDRQGRPQSFPLMGISIAVVCNRNGSLTHYGQVSAIAMQLKKKAKEDPGSVYVIDQRAQ